MTIRQKIQDDQFRKTATFIGVVAAGVGSVLTLGGLVFAGGEFRATTNRKLESISDQVSALQSSSDRHAEDEQMHPPFSIQANQFVLRKEWERAIMESDRQLKDVRESALRTEAKIDKIYELLRER